MVKKEHPNKSSMEQPYMEPPKFDAFDQDNSMREAMGSQRGKMKILESGFIQSTNWPSAGWRLTPLGIEFAGNTTSFPPGSIPLETIEQIAAHKVLGNSTAATGPIEELSAGAGISISGGAIASTITQYNDENAQDAVGGILTDSNTIDFTYNDAAPSIIADVRTQMSITSDASGLKFSGDASTPGNNKFYGTNGSGTKGWYGLKVIPLFAHFADAGNTGTGEDDLYSDTIPAAQLANNGEKLEVEYVGSFVSSATATRQIRIYFGGTLIFDTGALTLSLSAAWTAYVTVIRVSASVVRCSISLTTEGAALAAYTSYTEVTGLTLSNTQVLKITGEAAGVGAATNDIVAKMSAISWVAAP